MEVRPVPIDGRDRAARRGTLIAILLPVLVLVTVVGGGLLGALDEDRAAAVVREAAIDDPAAGEQAATPSPRPATVATPAATPGMDLPREILGLPVRGVRDARASPRRARPEQLVAVGGWLTIGPGDPACASSWYLACRRTGFISTSREPNGPSLYVETLRGVPLIGLTRQSPWPGTWTVPSRAIIVGRFTQPLYRECGLQVPDCEPVFTVERLAWIRLTEREPPVTLGPGWAGATRTAAEAETTARAALEAAGQGSLGDTLLVTGMDHAALELVAPDAAAAARAGDPVGTLWYVRTIVWRDEARDPVVGWAVVDDTSRRVLGSAIGGRTTTVAAVIAPWGP